MRSLTYPFDALVSFHYFRADEKVAKVADPSTFRLIADSGAFSAYTQGVEITLDEYAAWLKRWRDRFFWCASLDVFGDPEATLTNFRTLRDRHQLATVPTIHIGADPVWLDVYAREGVDFVGLGGMVGMSRPVQLRWLVHVLRYARDHHPQMRFHAWGMTTHSTLAALPLYSADSSGLLGTPFRFASLPIWDQHKRDITRIPLDGKTPYKHRRLLREQYDVTPDEVATSGSHNRKLLIYMAALSVQRRAAYLQQRHKIPAPTWGLREPDPSGGTRLHVAETSAKDFAALATPPDTAPRGTRTHCVAAPREPRPHSTLRPGRPR